MVKLDDRGDLVRSLIARALNLMVAARNSPRKGIELQVTLH